VQFVDRSPRVALGAAILVAFVVGTTVLVIDAGPTPALQVAPSGGVSSNPTPQPTDPPEAGSPRATPRGKEIYKGHTLEEILADPALLEEANSLSDDIRPIHGEPDPPLSNFGSDTVCPNHVECP